MFKDTKSVKKITRRFSNASIALKIDVPFKYHPGSVHNEEPGFVFYLDDGQLEELKRFIGVVEEQGIEVGKYLVRPAETEVLLYLRFLRARQFNVQAAIAMLKEDIEWREKENVLNILKETPEEILGCPEEWIMRRVPQWVQGFDKVGRPVIWWEFGNANIEKVLQHTTQEKLGRHHIYLMETFITKLSEQSEKLQYNIEDFALVIDAHGWKISYATSDAYNFVKTIVGVDSAHYPERLGKVIVIRAPMALATAWAIIKNWLDPRTRDKIEILDSDYHEKLFSTVDKDQIGPEYGGTGVSQKPKLPPKTKKTKK
uniref:CRAL-TRIO domain-containing protein n=1 Tax=Arcella intermedia TaxID=1963864 RepID=A0A6B2L9S6_9EUKA